MPLAGRISRQVLIYDPTPKKTGGWPAATRPFHPPLDVYVADALASSYPFSIGLRPFTAEPNVTVHTVTHQQWENFGQSRTMSLVVAYLDLMEAGDRGAAEVYRLLQSGRQ